MTTPHGAYYNEWEPYAAAWLRNLIAAGLIAPGEVDERSIVNVGAEEIRGFTQWHLFAGIGGWSAALRLAEWPDERSVLTASVPCQPFSAAGKRRGHADERNLWPHACRLIRELRPRQVFGEQVEAAIAYGWLDGVFDDLEREGYACAAVDLPAASVGAPHIRQRLFWVAERMGDADLRDPEKERTCAGQVRGQRSPQRRGPEQSSGAGAASGVGERDHAEGDAGGLAESDEGECRRFADGEGRERDGATARREQGDSEPEPGRVPGGLVNTASQRADLERASQSSRHGADDGISGATDPWTGAVWLPCLDGKARRVGVRVRGVVDGVPADLDGSGTDHEAEIIALLSTGEVQRASRLRALGNAIVPQVAAEFIRAYVEC